jgi:transcriptional regulator with XRE-family HTH domain
MPVQQAPDYGAMDPRNLSGGDLGRWEIWDAVRRSGRSMRDLSLEAGINESGIGQLLIKSQFTPQPATLRALANVDRLGLSYTRLMELFGHIDRLPEPDELDHMLTPLKRQLLAFPREKRQEVVRNLQVIVDMLK